MFNNLNNQNSSQNGSVDDIFAETDRADANSSREEIETRKVGLASSGLGATRPNLESNHQSVASSHDEMSSQMLSADQETPRQAKKGYLKVILIVVGVIVLGAAAYFAYLNFMPSNQVEEPFVSEVVENVPAAPSAESNFVEVIPEEIADAVNEGAGEEALVLDETSSTPSDLPPGAMLDFPGLNNEGLAENDFQNFVDSDGDGLSDEEEVVLGTNPNIIDSDNDGLSDYEEIKIYLSNPLSIDTDGDTYPDGEEVKAGYDPNAVGAKLPGNNR